MISLYESKVKIKPLSKTGSRLDPNHNKSVSSLIHG